MKIAIRAEDAGGRLVAVDAAMIGTMGRSPKFTVAADPCFLTLPAPVWGSPGGVFGGLAQRSDVAAEERSWDTKDRHRDPHVEEADLVALCAGSGVRLHSEERNRNAGAV